MCIFAQKYGIRPLGDLYCLDSRPKKETKSSIVAAVGLDFISQPISMLSCMFYLLSKYYLFSTFFFISRLCIL